MNRGIYSNATGMISLQKWMDITANNLANVSTNGYKRDTMVFGEVMEREMRANGGLGVSLGSIGSGAVPFGEVTVFERGAISATGNPLDVAIDDEHGLFAVQTPQGVRYTRDGAFTLNADRELVTKQGHPVLDDGLSTITIPLGEVSIDQSGGISVDDEQIGTLGIYDGQFRKEGHNLFVSDDAYAVDDVAVIGNAIENSNINPIEAMVDMIKIGRNYELSQKSIQQQDELIQRLIQSLQDR